MEIRVALRIVTVGMSPDHRDFVVGDALDWLEAAPRTRPQKVALVLDAALPARLDDPVGFVGLPVVGLCLVSAGSLVYAGGPEVASLLSTAMTALVVLTLAAVLRAQVYRPRVGAAVGVLIAIALLWEVWEGSVVVLGDLLAEAAMIAVAGLALVGLGGLVFAGRMPAESLPREIVRRAWTRWAWIGLVIAVGTIGLGDFLSAVYSPLQMRVQAGLLLNAAGLGMLATGMARALDPAVVTGTGR